MATWPELRHFRHGITDRLLDAGETGWTEPLSVAADQVSAVATNRSASPWDSGASSSSAPRLSDMAVRRLDHLGIIVDDMDAAVAFFQELGMEVEGRAPVEGQWVDRLCGLDGVHADITMVRTPDGLGRLELTAFHTPAALVPEPAQAPANTLGLRSIMFAVDDIDDVAARLRTHGAELIGTVEHYGDSYRLCYLRGPAGIIVALAEQLD